MNLTTQSNSEQVLRWRSSGRHILAQFDDEMIIVYQAYRHLLPHPSSGPEDMNDSEMPTIEFEIRKPT